MRFDKRKHGSGSRHVVQRHLENHLGPVASLSTIKLADKSTVHLHEHREAPGRGRTTLITNGLADFARRHAFAEDEGLAQELVMVLRTEYVLDMPTGWYAFRDSAEQAWNREKAPDDMWG